MAAIPPTPALGSPIYIDVSNAHFETIQLAIQTIRNAGYQAIVGQRLVSIPFTACVQKCIQISHVDPNAPNFDQKGILSTFQAKGIILGDPYKGEMSTFVPGYWN